MGGACLLCMRSMEVAYTLGLRPRYYGEPSHFYTFRFYVVRKLCCIDRDETGYVTLLGDLSYTCVCKSKHCYVSGYEYSLDESGPSQTRVIYLTLP
jgi:hypothetical protein